MKSYGTEAAAPVEFGASASVSHGYGSNRLAQYGAGGAEYFLTDALGSVRQVVNAAGTVILSKDYRPYGEALHSQGSGTSSYGFAGEWTDGTTGQSYLRARWYSSQQGRFISRDTWQGDYSRPASQNHWNYVEANPVGYVDPSGLCKCGGYKLYEMSLVFQTRYPYYVYDEWKQMPFAPGSPILPVLYIEWWLRDIARIEDGESWRVEACLYIDKNLEIKPEKLYLENPKVEVLLGRWRQDLVVVNEYTENLRYDRFNAGWNIRLLFGDKDQPYPDGSDGIWPYPDLPPLQTISH